MIGLTIILFGIKHKNNITSKERYLRSNECEKELCALITIDVPAKADIKLASLNCIVG